MIHTVMQSYSDFPPKMPSLFRFEDRFGGIESERLELCLVCLQTQYFRGSDIGVGS